MNAELSLYMQQEKMYSMEGYQGVDRLEQIVGVLGYPNITEFLADNSGAIEAMLDFISTWSERNSDWAAALQGELWDSEED